MHCLQQVSPHTSLIEPPSSSSSLRIPRALRTTQAYHCCMVYYKLSAARVAMNCRRWRAGCHQKPWWLARQLQGPFLTLCHCRLCQCSCQAYHCCTVYYKLSAARVAMNCRRWRAGPDSSYMIKVSASSRRLTATNAHHVI